MKMLAVIDMQKDFVDRALGTKEAVAIVPAVVKKIAEARKSVIVTTFDTHYDNYMNTLEGKMLPVPHCIKGTDGWLLNDDVAAALKGATDNGNLVITINKNTFGTMQWEDILKKYDIDEIEICGLCTDICVISNALILRALKPDMRIVADSGACAGVTPENHEAACKVMGSCQIEVI